MARLEEVGSIVEKRYDEIKIEWEIADFFFVAENKKEILCPCFAFMETPWFLKLRFKSSKPGFMCLRIWKVMTKRFEYSVEYNFDLKKRGGGVENLSKGILEGKQYWKDYYMKMSEIQQRQSELVLSDALIIACTLKVEIAHSDKGKGLDRSNVNKLIKLDTLSENFKRLFANKDNCDTTLYVMDKEYKAHRAVLIARSSVFAAMFQHETKEKETGIINIPDCDPESFEEFLKFLYCGKLEGPSTRSALHLYEISDKYDVQDLKTFCVKFLSDNLTVENFCEIAKFGDKHDQTNLLSAAQMFFNRNGSEIVETSEWDSLVENNYHLSKRLLKKALSLKKYTLSV